jgi:hypothetical protein
VIVLRIQAPNRDRFPDLTLDKRTRYPDPSA